MRDRLALFGGDMEIEYMKTENWHPERLLARGRIKDPTRSARVALLGCGALGAAVSELLARGGVHQMLLVDGDVFSSGNLVRHTLTGQDIGQGKAQAIAKRISAILPTATLRVHPKSIPDERGALETLLEDIDIVLDCTASNDVSLLLSRAWWSVPRFFISASTGYRAQRTFLFCCFGHSFDNVEFGRQIGPWLEAERQSWASQGETLEGAGCWSPVFPARYDDVFLAAVACVKTMELHAEEADQKPELFVFEQTYDQEAFTGIHRVLRMGADSPRSEMSHA